jgi:hypothetical protein
MTHIAAIRRQRPDSSSMNRERIRVGISACLLGESVRFDGGHPHPVELMLRNHVRAR